MDESRRLESQVRNQKMQETNEKLHSIVRGLIENWMDELGEGNVGTVVYRHIKKRHKTNTIEMRVMWQYIKVSHTYHILHNAFEL